MKISLVPAACILASCALTAQAANIDDLDMTITVLEEGTPAPSEITNEMVIPEDTGKETESVNDPVHDKDDSEEGKDDRDEIRDSGSNSTN